MLLRVNPTLTEAFGPVVIDRPSRIARNTFGSTVYSAPRASLTHAVITGAHIY